MRLVNSSPEEARTALHCNISAKLKYPLPVCTLFEAECKAMLFPDTRAVLPKAGISTYISSDYRDNNIDILGAGSYIYFTTWVLQG